MNTWQFIIEQYQEGNQVILLYVLESIGSSPGRRGFKMAVSSSGQLYGSIGGGIMEYKFVEMARSLLNETETKTAIFRQVHDTDSSTRSGMICSGEQTIFLHRIRHKDIPFIQSLVLSLSDRKNGTLKLSREGIFFENEKPENQNYILLNRENDFLYEETTGYKNILYIIGGGHCSLALSRIMHSMDFYIIVLDERTGLNTMEQNTFADKKICISSYSLCDQHVIEGNNVYVVIMTFGYRTDDLVVHSLIGKEFKYIGLLGSANKIKKMYDQYEMEYMDPAWLSKIHSPIGINIKSETVEEIAVSISAEIISIKNSIQ